MNIPDPKTGTTEQLLRAFVIAIRDNKHRYELRKLVACYPRVTNTANPFLSLLDRIQELQRESDNKSDKIHWLEERLEEATNKLKRYV